MGLVGLFCCFFFSFFFFLLLVVMSAVIIKIRVIKLCSQSQSNTVLTVFVDKDYITCLLTVDCHMLFDKCDIVFVYITYFFFSFHLSCH